MTLSEAQTQLAAWEAASLALASGRSYAIGDRQLTRANAQEVRDMITWLERKVAQLTSASAGGTARAALADFNH